MLPQPALGVTEKERRDLPAVPLRYLQAILSIAKPLLQPEMLQFLDDQATDVFVSEQIKIFPYKTFTEILILVIVSLLRELLQRQKGTVLPQFVQSKRSCVSKPFDYGYEDKGTQSVSDKIILSWVSF